MRLQEGSTPKQKRAKRCLGHIARVTLRVRDLEASIAFYRDVFGYRPISRYESPNRCFRQVNLAHRPWGNVLQFYEDLQSRESLVQGTGFLYLVIGVRDLEATCARVLEQGGRILTGPHVPTTWNHGWHDFGRRVIAAHRARGVRLAIVADPDGHPIELIPDRWIAQRLLLRDLLPLPLVHLFLQVFGLFRDGSRAAAGHLRRLPTGEMPQQYEDPPEPS